MLKTDPEETRLCTGLNWLRTVHLRAVSNTVMNRLFHKGQEFIDQLGKT